MTEAPLREEEIEAAKRNIKFIRATTTYSIRHGGSHSLNIRGDSKAFVRIGEDWETEVVIATAYIHNFLYGYLSDSALSLIADGESSELMNLAIAINNMRDIDSQFYDEDIDNQTRGFLIETFEVEKPFRNLGIGRTAARKMLISAGAPGHPVFAEPGVIGDDGPGIEIIDRFWTKLEPGMRAYDNKKDSLRIIYSPELPTNLD